MTDTDKGAVAGMVATREIIKNTYDHMRNDRLKRILAGQSPRVIWEDVDGKIHVKEGYLNGSNTFTSAEKPTIKRILACGLEPVNGSSLYNIFQGCTNLEEIYPLISGKATNVLGLCNGCTQLKTIDLHLIDTSSVSSYSSTFRNCSNLEILDISKWNCSSVTAFDYMFLDSKNIKSLIGGRQNLDEVLFEGVNRNLSGAIYLGTTQLDRYSLRAIINGLADRTGQTSLTLTIGNTLKAKLTEEDIAIATAKNWVIA